jgi:rubredoxin
MNTPENDNTPPVAACPPLSVGLGVEVKPGQYRCEMCGGVFDFAWSDEEAKAEAESKGLDVLDCGVVCDDCYKLTPWGAPNVQIEERPAFGASLSNAGLGSAKGEK